MDRQETLSATLRPVVESGTIPGVVALAICGGQIVYETAFGRRSLATEPDSAVAMTTDTVFNIASMTKAVTAAACMQLVEQGRIGLDDDVGKIVASLAAPRVLEGFDAQDRPILRPAKRALTLRTLMTHTSGFAYDTWNPLILRYMRHTGRTRVETFRSADTCLPLAFDPGEGWAYGFGMEWTGKVIEALAGQTLEHYLHTHIFEPLGMTSTGHRVTANMAARLAETAGRTADGSLQPLDLPPPTDPEGFMGGGGLHSTVGDYARFLLMLLGGGALDGARLLKAETVALMSRNHMGDRQVAPLISALPDLSRDVELFPGMKKQWGLSFLINTEDMPGGRRAGSLAWAGLRNTYYWIDPSSGIAGIVMTQILPFGDEAVLEMLGAFERAVYAAYG